MGPGEILYLVCWALMIMWAAVMIFVVIWALFLELVVPKWEDHKKKKFHKQINNYLKETNAKLD